MKRRALAAVIVLGVGIGLIDPYACVQHSSGNSLNRDVPARERARVLVAARRALALVPAPRGYVLDAESVTSEAETSAPWSDAGARWAAPVAARAERAYEPPDPDARDAPPPLEQRVFVNAEVALPTGLASESGPTRTWPIAGAAAVLVTTAGTEEASPRERVALPITPGQAASSLAIIRVLIADPATERAFAAAAGSGQMAVHARKPPRRVGSVETLVVELYGGRKDVEALARRLPTADLRRLLAP